MPIKLNVDEDSTDLNIIYALLTSTPERLVWLGQECYSLDSQKYILSHNIIGIMINGKLCYQVLANEYIYYSPTTSILEADHFFTLSPNDKTLNFFYPNARVIKVIRSVVENEPPSKKLVLNEYKKSKLAGHLDVSYPIFYKNMAFISMLRMPGMNLLNFIDRCFSLEAHLPIKFLFMLTDAILQAILKQVVKLRLIHLNINLKHLILDVDGRELDNADKHELENLSAKRVKINCIDYANCLEIGESKDLSCEANPYVYPEYTNAVFYDEGPDVYAVGVILQVIFGLTKHHSYGICENERDRLFNKRILEQIYLYEYHNQKDEISYSTFLNLVILTLKMVETNPKDRWSLRQSINAFEYIVKSSVFSMDSIFSATRKYDITKNYCEIMLNLMYKISAQALFGCLIKREDDVDDEDIDEDTKLIERDVNNYNIPDNSIVFTGYTDLLKGHISKEIEVMERAAKHKFFPTINDDREKFGYGTFSDCNLKLNL